MSRPIAAIVIIGLFCGAALANPRQDNTDISTRYAPHAGPKPETPLTVTYTNKRYRFRFYLPEDWRGFSIIADSWSGRVREESGKLDNDTVECGPRITIRHPRWTGTTPYKDIPIMVFTHDQWKVAANDRISVSAAPFAPYELGRNRKYVFALPPRWSVGEEMGSDEVIEAIKQHPLHPL